MSCMASAEKLNIEGLPHRANSAPKAVFEGLCVPIVY